MKPRTAGLVHVAAIVLLACALQPPAFAQSDIDIAEAVRACQLVADLSARLACYDRAFPPLPQGAAEPGARASQGEALGARARIVEIEMPSLRTTVFHAEDGRVFVRDRATTVIQWPDTPVDVEVQTSMFGTSTYLKFPGAGPRVRVTIRD
jgi:hypothetical protein